MSIFRLIGPLLIAIACALSPVAKGAEVLTDQAWVEDPSGSMSLQEVMSQPQTPFEGKNFTRGFSRSHFWIRLHIDPRNIPNEPADGKLIIRIRPPYQNEVQLFDPLDRSGKKRITGSETSWYDDEYRSLNLNFSVPVGSQPRDIWLRLRTNKSTLTVIEVMTEAEARMADRKLELKTMLYLSVLIACMGWGVLSWINTRDRLVGKYIIRELLTITYTLVMLGFFREFAAGLLEPQTMDIVFTNVVFIFIVYVIWFDANFIKEFKPHPWLIKPLLYVPLTLVADWVLLAFDQFYLAMMLNAYLVLIALGLIFLATLSTRAWKETKDLPLQDQPVFSKQFLICLYGFVVIALLVNRLPVMGFIVPSDGFLYLNLLYALLSSVSIMILVQVRSHRLQKWQQEIKTRLDVAQAEINKERERRIEQSNFLKMLAHEMKTPLSVVRMTVGSGQLPLKASDRVHRAIANMNNVIERLLDVERLHDEQLTLDLKSFDLVQLIHEIASFTPQERIILDIPERFEMHSDLRFVRIILSNLLDNANKYGGAESPIFVGFSEDGDLARIRVENAIGPSGLPNSDKIFEKYYRAPSALSITGSGLGLYLTKYLVGMLGGEIHYSVEGAQVRFEVILPRNLSK